MSKMELGFKIVEVVWEDTRFIPEPNEFVSLDELKNAKPVILKTVGYLVAENKNAVVIANTLDFGDLTCRWIHVIPKRCIINMDMVEDALKFENHKKKEV